MRASLVALGCGVLLAQTAQAPRVFRSAADAVRVDALVTDGHKPIGGLTAADFDVRDSGIAQAVEAVQIVDVPFSMLMVLDTSSSMTGTPLKELQEAARAAVDALAPDDRASVMTFTERISQASPWQRDRGPVRSAVERVRADGATSLFDAAFAADFRTRYVLTYVPRGVPESGWHPIDIQIKGRRAHVTARRGYER